MFDVFVFFLHLSLKCSFIFRRVMEGIEIFGPNSLLDSDDEYVWIFFFYFYFLFRLLNSKFVLFVYIIF